MQLMQCSSTQAKAFLAYLHFCIQFFSCLAKQVKKAQSLGGPFLNWETQSILLLLGHPNFHSKRLSEKEIQIPLLVGVLPAQFSSIDSYLEEKLEPPKMNEKHKLRAVVKRCPNMQTGCYVTLEFVIYETRTF